MIKESQDTIMQAYNDLMQSRNRYDDLLHERIKERDEMLEKLEEIAKEAQKMVKQLLRIGNELIDERNELRDDRKMLYGIVKECDHCLPK